MNAMSQQPTSVTTPRKRGKRGIKISVLALLSIPLLVASCRTRLTPLPPEEQRGYQSLLEWSHRNGLPGAILLVRTPGREFVGSVGDADLKNHLPMRADHAFQIGSVTKSFVGVVAAQMHAEGKLNLDAIITNSLPPDITKHFPNVEKITLRQMLEHTAGLYDAGLNPRRVIDRAFVDRRGEYSALRELKYAFDKPPSFAPGEGWSYSNTGYLLAGLMIDRAAGQHHSAEVRRRVLVPLRLTNTWYNLLEQPRGDMARGYEDFFNWWRADTTSWTPAIGGSAGLSSTVFDLATFIRAVARDAGFLNAATRRELFGGWSEEKKRYFLGLQRMRPRKDAPWFIGHSGGTPGYHCFAFHQPERDITIVFFGSSALLKARGIDRLLGEFHDTLRNALFEASLKESPVNEQNEFDPEGEKESQADIQGDAPRIGPAVSLPIATNDHIAGNLQVIAVIKVRRSIIRKL
jgi:D-alanyl-D-alanine carboxypeptidase